MEPQKSHIRSYQVTGFIVEQTPGHNQMFCNKLTLHIPLILQKTAPTSDNLWCTWFSEKHRSKTWKNGKQCPPSNVILTVWMNCSFISEAIKMFDKKYAFVSYLPGKSYVCMCKMRYLREDFSTPACSQCEEAWPQVPSRIYCSPTVSWHWHGDPKDDHCHYRRNQLCGSGGVPLFTQTQDAQHQHAGAHDLMKCVNVHAVIMSSIKEQLLK